MILIIDNYDSFTYNLYQVIATFYPEVMVARNDQITLNEIQHLHPAGVILSPGPGRPENAGICIELIHAINKNTPLLGVCLGHQAITVALGGQVVQAQQIMHGKQDIIFHYRQHLYKNLPLPFHAGRYHSLITDVNTLSDQFIIEAVNAEGLVMGMRHRSLPIFGVQFHPESILTPFGHILLKEFAMQCVSYKKSMGVVVGC